MTESEFIEAARAFCATINSKAWVAATVFATDKPLMSICLYEAVKGARFNAEGNDLASALDALKAKFAAERSEARNKTLAEARAILAEAGDAA